MIIDDVIELVLDLIFDVSVELIPNKSVPKCLRYLLAIFVILVFVAVTLGIILLGLLLIKESLLGSLLLIILGFILLIGGILKVKKYLNINNQGKKE